MKNNHLKLSLFNSALALISSARAVIISGHCSAPLIMLSAICSIALSTLSWLNNKKHLPFNNLRKSDVSFQDTLSAKKIALNVVSSRLYLFLIANISA